MAATMPKLGVPGGRCWPSESCGLRRSHALPRSLPIPALPSSRSGVELAEGSSGIHIVQVGHSASSKSRHACALCTGKQTRPTAGASKNPCHAASLHKGQWGAAAGVPAAKGMARWRKYEHGGACDARKQRHDVAILQFVINWTMCGRDGGAAAQLSRESAIKPCTVRYAHPAWEHQRAVHTLPQAGESISGIAQRYNMTAQELKASGA
jgi:hypothetical protein